ncbi:MAG: DNA alkylation repair protein [Gemmobacter sp.]|uniref:DNA alkylation repair protein n=1 Tax=Gemmobacter sp. TaxID=1898957 RepID=UPI00391C9AF3
MTPEAALAALQALADEQKAAEMAAYHKVPRPYLGIAVPQIDALAREWRQTLPLPDRLALADALWRMGIHESMVAAAKLLEQARIRPDDSGAWALIAGWAETFDGWAVADHAAIAGQKRLVADPSRVETVQSWTNHPNMWTRRAALVMTLPWAKMNFPKPADLAIRDRVLGWCAGYADDRDWFIQKAVAWWLRDLSRHDPARARDFLAAHGARLKAFARKEAARYL